MGSTSYVAAIGLELIICARKLLLPKWCLESSNVPLPMLGLFALPHSCKSCARKLNHLFTRETLEGCSLSVGSGPRLHILERSASRNENFSAVNSLPTL